MENELKASLRYTGKQTVCLDDVHHALVLFYNPVGEPCSEIVHADNCHFWHTRMREMNEFLTHDHTDGRGVHIVPEERKDFHDFFVSNIKDWIDPALPLPWRT